jgi:putative Mn2+ efflux pump MntP
MALTWVLVLEVFLIGLSLSMDAFAVSVTDGLCYRNLTKVKGATIPLAFGLFQAVMPLIGYFVAFGLGQAFEEIFDKIDHWIAFVLLAIIGGKMIYDAIKQLRSKEEEIKEKKYSVPEVLVQGVATSIDALFVGVSFAATEGFKNSIPNVLVGVAIIGVTTFAISLAGVLIGVKIGNVLKNKSGIATLIGGLVLIGIGLKILIEGLI